MSRQARDNYGDASISTDGGVGCGRGNRCRFRNCVVVALPLLVPAILEATFCAAFFLAPESLEPALAFAALDKLSLAIEKPPCVQ
jgi:hypothetical protein